MTITLNDIPTSNTIGMPIQINGATGNIVLGGQEASVLLVSFTTITLGPRVLRHRNAQNRSFDPGHIANFCASGNNIELRVGRPGNGEQSFLFD